MNPTYEVEFEGNCDPKQLEIELNVAVSDLPQMFPGLIVHVRTVTDNYMRPPRGPDRNRYTPLSNRYYDETVGRWITKKDVR